MSDIIEKIGDIEECMVKALDGHISSGLEGVDTKEAGEVADIIKDLATAKYYCTVTKAMEEAGEEYWDEETMGYTPRVRGTMSTRYGYNNSSTNNRPHRMGFRPYMDEEPYIYDYIQDGRMGYNDIPRSVHGRDYDEWKEAKRHYNETHSQADKDVMSEKTRSHLHNVIDGLKEMWADADATLRQSMKADLTAMLSQM